MSDNPDQTKQDTSTVNKYKSQWAFTHFERRALWILSLFLISGTALRMYNNHQLSSNLELVPASRLSSDNLSKTAIIDDIHVDFPVNINTATQAELEQIPGIGPVKALAIINYIKTNGAIQNSGDILNVKGIGPATLRKMEEFIVTEP